MTTVTIHVTRGHILAARNRIDDGGYVHRNCPIALALHDAGYPDAGVSDQTWGGAPPTDTSCHGVR